MTDDGTPINAKTDFSGTDINTLRDDVTRLVALAECDDLDADTRATFRAEAKAVAAELRARAEADLDVETDGGHDHPTQAEADYDDACQSFDGAIAGTVARVADGGVDNPYADLDADEDTVEGMHKRRIDTVVEDGDVVHIVDITALPTDGATSFNRAATKECPRHEDADVDKVGEESIDVRDGSGVKTTYACSEDGCPFRVYYVEADYGDAAPTGFDDRDAVHMVAHVPANDPEDVFDDGVDTITDDDGVVQWGLFRHLTVMAEASSLNDVDYYADEDYDADPGDKNYYLHTVKCARCGTEVRESHSTTHPHFGDVCDDCSDATVWSVDDDGDIPDDVAAKFDAHKTVSHSKVVTLLREVVYLPVYKGRDVNAGQKVGKQGKRDAHAMGRGRPGTGLRRPHGAFHGKRHWRTLLSDAVDAGLIERVDDTDVDDDHASATYRATDKGLAYLDDNDRCETCGGRVMPYKRTSTYHVGRYPKKDTSLSFACPTCDAKRSKSDGAMVIRSSSGKWSLAEIDGVDYEDD